MTRTPYIPHANHSFCPSYQNKFLVQHDIIAIHNILQAVWLTKKKKVSIFDGKRELLYLLY